MKIRLTTCLRLTGPLLAIALLAGVIGVAGANGATARPTTASPSYLFSISTASGSLTGRGDGHLTLKLVGARDYLTRFTDRPFRQASVVANVDFARRFTGYFGRSDPNAVLTYTPAGTRVPVSIVLTVGQPHWSAQRATWTFLATRIRKQPDSLPGTTVPIKPPVIPNPRSFAHGTLLIDDTAASGPLEVPSGGIADALEAFLQQLFTTSPTWSPGQQFRIGLAVDFQIPIEPSAPTVQLPILLLAPHLFAPTSDWRIQPSSFACVIESKVIDWQNRTEPDLADGARYSFALALYGVGRAAQSPIDTTTLQYPIPLGGAVTSRGCS